jgi:predicted transcriptional regulator
MPGETREGNSMQGFLQGEIHNILVPGINALGSLESQVMDVIWRLGDAEVSDIYFSLRESDPRAGTREEIKYTTVLTVMNRLVKKGLLRQDKSQRAYKYSPTITKDAYAQTQTDKVIDWLTRHVGLDMVKESLGRSAQALTQEKKKSKTP